MTTDNASPGGAFEFTAAPAPASAALPPAAAGSTASTPEQIANALYPEPKTADQVRAYGSAPIPQLDNPPAEVAALRQADGLASVNLEGSFKTSTGSIKELFEAADLTAAPESVAKQVLEFKAMAHDLQADHDDVTMLATMAKAALETPVSADEHAANERQAVGDLRAKYGRDWNRVLDDTKRLVARDPRLNDFLKQTGLGSHPRVVGRLAELAVQARSRGRLK